jgi:serine protease SohB
MIEFLSEYGLFLLKTVTLVVAVIAIIGAVAAAGKKAAHQEGLEVEDLNKKYKSMASALKQAVMKKADWKKEAKAEKERDKAEAKADEARPRAFIIDFKGDLKASAVPSLREEVSALLEVASREDQVVVRLENYGGVVHEHGLAASQLVRIRDKDSIGVLAQIPNFNRMLDSHGVDFEQITAGKYKRSVTMFGKNTDEDRAKLKEELEDVHLLFKGAVTKYRPDMDMDKIATGEHWYGTRALEFGLADELKTSDELLAELAKDHDLYRLAYKIKQPLQKRLMAGADAAMERVDALGWRKRFEDRLPR